MGVKKKSTLATFNYIFNNFMKNTNGKKYKNFIIVDSS